MKLIKSLFKLVLIVVAASAVVSMIYLAYMGLFSELKVYQKETGPYTMAYESFTGPYKDTGIIFNKVYTSLEADGVKTLRGIGIYYDDPKVTPADKLRSDNGCVIEEKDFSRLPALRKKYSIKTIPRQLRIITEFSIKGPLSFMLGPIKGYPALMKYAKEKNVKWAKDAMPIEYYDFPANKIYYMMGIVKEK